MALKSRQGVSVVFPRHDLDGFSFPIKCDCRGELDSSLSARKRENKIPNVNATSAQVCKGTHLDRSDDGIAVLGQPSLRGSGLELPCGCLHYPMKGDSDTTSKGFSATRAMTEGLSRGEIFALRRTRR